MKELDHTASVRSLFNRKAPEWSAKYREGAALTWRIDAFTRAVAELRPPPARLLDFGCGTGELAAAFAARGYVVTGGDIAESMLAEARRAFGDQVTWRLLEPSPRLPFDDGAFDVVVASSVLEYLADARAVIAEWARVLGRGGVLAFTVPNVWHPIRLAERGIALAASVPAVGLLARMSPRSKSYLEYVRLSKNRHTRRGWQRLLGEHGLVPAASWPPAAGPLDLLTFSLLNGDRQ